MHPTRFAFCLCKELLDRIKYKLKDYFLGFKVFLNVENWKDYYLDSKGKTKEKFITFDLKNGIKIKVRAKTKDRDIFSEIFFGNEYFTDDFVLPENSVVFDVGAHIGVFSVFISQKARKVFSFEPVPENFELLKKNIELNKLEKKVFAFNSAVSNKKGTETIFIHRNNTGGASIYGEGKNIKAESVALKEVFESNKIEKCDLMKIDIEGGEYNLLYNAQKEVLKKIKLIAIECHRIDENQNNPEKLIEFLQEKGFEIKKKRKSFGMVRILAELKSRNNNSFQKQTIQRTSKN